MRDGRGLRWARRQAEAVAAIQEAGGFVLYDCHYVEQQEKRILQGAGPWEPKWLIDSAGIDFFHQVRYVSFAYGNGNMWESNTTEELYTHLEELPHIRRLLLVEGQVTDRRMEYVANLEDLEALILLDARALTDAGVQRLVGLRNLKYLYISNSEITDESVALLGTHCPELRGLVLPANHLTNQALEHASNLPNLRKLVVGSGECSINDDGLAHVKALEELQTLGIQETRVSDAGLKHLKNMDSLRELWVNGTAITATGAAELQQALPNLKIRRIAADDGVLVRPQ